MDATFSALTNQVTTQGINWVAISTSPVILAIISSGITAFVLRSIFNMGGLNQKFISTIEDISDLKKDVKKLVSHVDKIISHLTIKTGLSADLFASNSQIVLLKKGIELLEKSGFKKIFKDNKEYFLSEVKKYNIKTLSDLDEASYKVIEKIKEEGKFMDYKEVAFQNGVIIDVLLKVFSIYMREIFAKELLSKNDVKSRDLV